MTIMMIVIKEDSLFITIIYNTNPITYMIAKMQQTNFVITFMNIRSTHQYIKQKSVMIGNISLENEKFFLLIKILSELSPIIE